MAALKFQMLLRQIQAVSALSRCVTNALSITTEALGIHCLPFHNLKVWNGCTKRQYKVGRIRRSSARESCFCFHVKWMRTRRSFEPWHELRMSRQKWIPSSYSTYIYTPGKQRQWKWDQHKHGSKLDCNMTAVEKNMKSPAETNQAKQTKPIDQEPVWQHRHVLQGTVKSWEKVWILSDGLKVGQKCGLL